MNNTHYFIRVLICASLCLPLYINQAQSHDGHSGDDDRVVGDQFRKSGGFGDQDGKTGDRTTRPEPQLSNQEGGDVSSASSDDFGEVTSHWVAAKGAADSLSSSIGAMHANTQALSARHRDFLDGDIDESGSSIHNVILNLAPKAAEHMENIVAQNAKVEETLAEIQANLNTVRADIQAFNDDQQQETPSLGKTIHLSKLKQNTNALNTLEQQFQTIASNSGVTMQELEQAEEQLQSEVNAFKASHSVNSDAADILEAKNLSADAAASKYRQELSQTRASYADLQTKLDETSVQLDALQEQLGHLRDHLE